MNELGPRASVAIATPGVTRAILAIATPGVTLAILLAGCATAPMIPASGELRGERIRTTVDSPVARHYLERSTKDEALDARIDEIERRYAGRIPTREELTRVARETSVDFAALLFARSVLADACNARMARSFDRHLASAGAPIPNGSRHLILFVPGWDYVDGGHASGADFARPRALAAELGLRTRLVPIGARGVVEDSARFLGAEIARHVREGERVILASASSGGVVTLLALAEHVGPEARGGIAGWLNVGGILRGSPLVEHLFSGVRRPFAEMALAWKGWDRGAVMSIGAGEGRARFERLRLDPAIPVVNYVGVPLSGQVGRHSRSTYPALAR